MSYLLTEIALDMLGYKFYDINGQYHITDFQNLNHGASDSQEASLEAIIYPNESKNANDATSIDSDECVEVPNLPVPSISVNQDHLMMLNLKEAVDNEYKRLHDEISSNKAKFLEENLKMLKKKDRNTKVSQKQVLKSYNERERANVLAEAEMMKEFLECVERKLEEANPDRFEAHKRYRMEEYL